MTLQTQLANLKREKKAAAKDLHRTYVHTKRDLKRAVSPDRMIRRHLGASIGAAAIAGLLLAPAPSRHAKTEAQATRSNKKKPKIKSRKLRWALGLVRHFLPQAAAYIPGLNPDETNENARDDETSEPAKKKKPRTLPGIIAPILLDMVSLLLQNVSVQALLTSWMGRRNAPQEPEQCCGGDPAQTQDSADGGEPAAM